MGKCCNSTTHFTNFDEEGYIGNIRDMVKEVGKQLRNLCHTKRVKEVKILNPAVLMGISGTPAPSTETMYCMSCGDMTRYIRMRRLTS